MGSIKSVICPAPMGGEENSMREFLFGSSPPSLRMDLIRIAVWAPLMVILGVVMEHSWFVFIPFIVLWTAVTLGKHLYWNRHPSKAPKPPQVTRYTKS
jgi:hypothetical protein